MKKPLELKNLPFELQRKYQHSILFANQAPPLAKSCHFDLTRLKERRAEKQKTMQQRLGQFSINPTELKYLMRVFCELSKDRKYFTSEDIHSTVQKMGIRMTKVEVERMIWEFDENLDKRISEQEFINMYKKCTLDKAGAETKHLFHLAQFLMYCRENKYSITVEDTLELLFVRAKDQVEAEKVYGNTVEKEVLRRLEVEIEVIFDKEEKTAEGIEKEIGFGEYLERISKRAIRNRQKEIMQAKSAFKYGSQK